jgi:hypothetical protein
MSPLRKGVKEEKLHKRRIAVLKMNVEDLTKGLQTVKARNESESNIRAYEMALAQAKEDLAKEEAK